MIRCHQLPWFCKLPSHADSALALVRLRRHGHIAAAVKSRWHSAPPRRRLLLVRPVAATARAYACNRAPGLSTIDQLAKPVPRISLWKYSHAATLAFSMPLITMQNRGFRTLAQCTRVHAKRADSARVRPSRTCRHTTGRSLQAPFSRCHHAPARWASRGKRLMQRFIDCDAQ